MSAANKSYSGLFPPNKHGKELFPTGRLFQTARRRYRFPPPYLGRCKIARKHLWQLVLQFEFGYPCIEALMTLRAQTRFSINWAIMARGRDPPSRNVAVFLLASLTGTSARWFRLVGRKAESVKEFVTNFHQEFLTLTTTRVCVGSWMLGFSIQTNLLLSTSEPCRRST